MQLIFAVSLDTGVSRDIHCKRLRNSVSEPDRRGERATLRDLARLVGVSTSTASRALNQNSSISEEVRRRVARAAKELNYQPNSLARGLALSRSRMIGLVVPSIANPFFAEIARGAHDSAYARGYVVTLCDTQRRAESAELFARTLLQSNVDGVILAGGVMAPEQMNSLRSRGLPMVLAGRRVTGSPGPCVSVDNVSVGLMATNYLLSKGHTRIAFLSGPPDSPGSRDRERGYREAMEAKGLPSARIQGAYTMECGFQEAERMAREGLKYTAIFAANDMLGIGLIMGLANAGIHAPADIAVIGCDDIPTGSLIKPSLTTIRVPMYEIGSRAMSLLLSRLESGGEDAPTESVLLDCELVERESTNSTVIPSARSHQ